jgi:hypothetical protein
MELAQNRSLNLLSLFALHFFLRDPMQRLHLLLIKKELKNPDSGD